MSATTDLTTRSSKPARQSRRWELLLLLSSLLAALLFGIAAYYEIAMAPWRKHQQTYRAALIANATDEQTRRAAESFQMRFYQSYLPALGRVDRCPTCHLGVENPAMKDAKEPVLRTHPGDILMHHPVDRFGCTICHGGVGRATEKREAHGKEPHRPAHFLTGADKEMLEVGCAKCHSDPELPGVPTYNLSRKLFTEKGCLACHSLRGTGPLLRGVAAIQGPDLTEEADKHDFQWHVDHFLDPQKTVEGSKMPNFGFTEKEAHALAYLVMSFTGESPSSGYIPQPTIGGGTSMQPPVTPEELGRNIDPNAAPGYVGSQTCLSCHSVLTSGVAHAWQNSKMAHAFDAIADVPDREICLPCHTTGHNPDTNVFSEPNVGCEACHGPGKSYVADILAGKIEDHGAQAIANVLQHDRCVNCHTMPHFSKEKHVAAVRAEHGAPNEATTGEEDSAFGTEESAFGAADELAGFGDPTPPPGDASSTAHAEETDAPLAAPVSKTAEELAAAMEAMKMIDAVVNPQAAPGYVGSGPCLFCHTALNPEVVDHWQNSKMGHAFELIADVPQSDRAVCLPCHTTGHNPNTGAFIEPNVGCESCHGPGRDYCIDAMEKRRPEHVERSRASHQEENRCANCHQVHVPREKHVQTIREREMVQ